LQVASRHAQTNYARLIHHILNAADNIKKSFFSLVKTNWATNRTFVG